MDRNMKLLLKIALLLACFSQLLIFTGCKLREPLPMTAQDISCHRVKVADGPEDFVLDKWNGPPRLLVSSHDRRNPETSGGIYYLDLQTEQSGEIKRIGEPETIKAFKPHGMDIVRKGHETFLYVIIHDPYARMKREENAIVIYSVLRNSIKFKKILEDPEHLWSPNDLSVLTSGEIYVTNDRRGSLDMYLRRETSEISYYNSASGVWQKAADQIAFANGILAEENQVYVTATLGNKLLMFPRFKDGRLGESTEILRVKGADNLMKYDDYLLTTAHYDDMAFLKHKKDPKEIAPSIVFKIRPELYLKEALYTDSGKMISAASTAMIYNRKLYISQVFDPYVVVCDVPAVIY